MRPTTFWPYKEYGSTRQANAELRSLLGRGMFENPKPVRLVKHLLRLGTDKDFVVLDFFAGSCTTACAVMKLNKEDNGNRKFIMVQLPEKYPENSEAYKAGYKTGFFKAKSHPHNVGIDVGISPESKSRFA